MQLLEVVDPDTIGAYCDLVLWCLRTMDAHSARMYVGLANAAFQAMGASYACPLGVQILWLRCFIEVG